MNRDAALALIKKHEAELKALGVVSLSLFGSTARGEATALSDVDVAVRLEDIPSGFATFERLDRIRDLLTSILAVPVDVIAEPKQPNRIKSSIDKDRHLAF
jgi:predicted nucleotidyltransferase